MIEQNYDYWLNEINEDAFVLEHVPIEYKTVELCELAVSNCGLALVHVPKTMQTVELCLIALKQHSWALPFIPKEIAEEVEELYYKEIEEEYEL